MHSQRKEIKADHGPERPALGASPPPPPRPRSTTADVGVGRPHTCQAAGARPRAVERLQRFLFSTCDGHSHWWLMTAGVQRTSRTPPSCQTHSVQQPPHEVHLGGVGEPPHEVHLGRVGEPPHEVHLGGVGEPPHEVLWAMMSGSQRTSMIPTPCQTHSAQLNSVHDNVSCGILNSHCWGGSRGCAQGGPLGVRQGD